MDNQPKRLYRSNKNRMLAGICGGIAEYFNTDPTIVRLIAVVGFCHRIRLFLGLFDLMDRDPGTTHHLVGGNHGSIREKIIPFSN